MKTWPMPSLKSSVCHGSNATRGSTRIHMCMSFTDLSVYHLDSDKSGKIDAIEVRGIFKELKMTISEDEVEALIITYDTDKSGMLEREEFMKMAQEVGIIG